MRPVCRLRTWRCAFPLAHPGVTGVNFGVRNMRQFNDAKAGFGTRLTDDVLDAIDACNPPGSIVDEADRGWIMPWMAPEARRRQPLRAAALDIWTGRLSAQRTGGVQTMAQHNATIANAAVTPARPTRARRRLRELRPMLWFAPVLLLLLTVTLYPTLFVLWMSFQKTKFYELTGFVGLANFVDTLSSRAFWEMTYTSLVYMVASLVLSLGLGVLAALVLNNLRRGSAVLRVLTLVPWTLSMAVVGTIWLWLFNPSYGPISYSMRQLGMSPGLMLGDPELALWLTVLVTSWWSFPTRW